MEEKSSKYFYSISEVAEKFQIAASKLRFWESKFDFLRPHTNAKGTRQYTQEDIETIKLIHYYVEERGMTLDGAYKQIKNNRGKALTDVSVTDELIQLRGELMAIRKELNQLTQDISSSEDESFNHSSL